MCLGRLRCGSCKVPVRQHPSDMDSSVAIQEAHRDQGYEQIG